jgi:hypothetical protein
MRQRTRQRGPARWAVAPLLLLGCALPGRPILPLERLEQAVDRAASASSFRVHGSLGGVAKVVQWDGVVAGDNEQYTISTGGLLIESRRVDGTSWARRVDRPDRWTTVPYDSPLDLTTLLRGRVVNDAEGDGSAIIITVAYDDSVDVLEALGHIPSAGATTADISLDDGCLTAVTLRMGGHITAELRFWDYGREVAITAPT